MVPAGAAGASGDFPYVVDVVEKAGVVDLRYRFVIDMASIGEG